MQRKMFNRLLAFSLFFIAHWFFGNVYEQIVLAPNQLTNSYDALERWQGYFTVTNQIYYYVPFTQIAVLLICFLYFKSKDKAEKKLLKKAAVFGVLSLIITALIVTQLNLKLFFGDINQHKEELFTLSVMWLIGNGIRITLVGSTLYFTFKTYLLRKAVEANIN
jgi:heme/copper-type cytochrome/quinol oxidase subunit 4